MRGKRAAPLLLAAAMTLSLWGCGGKDEGNIPVEEFSWWNALNTWKKDDPRVSFRKFKNRSEQKVETAEEAIERAKAECSVAYDTTEVGRDPESDVWMVHFYLTSAPQEGQLVYLDGNGYTRMIVTGA